jgi:hypothetical protein
MRDERSTVVLVVRPGANPRRSSEVMRWIRALAPAALIVVSSVAFDAGTSDDMVTLQCDDVDSGPLAVADALGKALIRHN